MTLSHLTPSDVERSKSSSLTFPAFNKLLSQKQQVLGVKHTPKSLYYPVLCGHYHLVKQSVKAPWLLVLSILRDD